MKLRAETRVSKRYFGLFLSKAIANGRGLQLDLPPLGQSSEVGSKLGSLTVLTVVFSPEPTRNWAFILTAPLFLDELHSGFSLPLEISGVTTNSHINHPCFFTTQAHISI
jgi:hypothetical protein